jgi:tRNA(Ile)-lysidine synthase
MEAGALRARIEEHVRRHDLVDAGGAVVCLVSGGPDSTCLWHALTALGCGVDAVHVNHKLRGVDSDEDARFCAERFDARVVEAPAATGTEAELRDIRYSLATDRLRATGHTASDQVETILYRLATSGRATGIRVRREDGVVRPLLAVWRDETEAYCRAEGLPFRVDRSNDETVRGLIRRDVLPALRRLHPAAERNILAALEEPPDLPRPAARALADLVSSREGSKRVDLGNGRIAVREYETVWLERAPVALDRPVTWGEWTIEADRPGLRVRAWRAGDRLAGRAKKVHDVFIDAKVPRSEREAWPLVVHGDDVVAVPGITAAPGWERAVIARRREGHD